jgi:hypothetical protein
MPVGYDDIRKDNYAFGYAAFYNIKKIRIINLYIGMFKILSESLPERLFIGRTQCRPFVELANVKGYKAIQIEDRIKYTKSMLTFIFLGFQATKNGRYFEL